jgi:arylsulfatase A-like enzyme
MRGVFDSTNIIVASDHGFSTETGGFTLGAFVEPFAKTLADGSKDIVVAEGAIYLRGNPDQSRLTSIVAALQRRPEVGAIFTRPGSNGTASGIIPGTLSFDVAHWNHPRSGDILVSANWTAKANAAGFKGTSTQEGVAGHGTSSPYDIHNTLMAAGPDFREHATSRLPTSNVDLAPTLLHLLGIPPPPTMTGRVIEEGLRGERAPLTKTEASEVVRTSDGRYTLRAHLSIVGTHRYLDYTDVRRADR